MFKNLAYRIYDFFTFKQIRHLKYFIELEKKTISELEEFQIEKLRIYQKNYQVYLLIIGKIFINYLLQKNKI